MNQSMGANSLSQKYDGQAMQRDKTDELWKVPFAPPQPQASQNTNQVYENLLHICENIDAALPEIQSTGNNGELHVDEHACLADNTTLPDMYLQGTEFDDIGPCLDDIQVYNDVWNSSAYMLCNSYDMIRSTQLASDFNSDGFSSNLNHEVRLSNPCKDIRNPYNQIQTLSPSPSIRSNSTPSNNIVNKEEPIFSDSEIEEYIRKRKCFYDPVKLHRPDENEDPLQLWRKLNSNDEQCSQVIVEEPTPAQKQEIMDDAEKPAKSLLAIFDFTIPSSSSSGLSSPAQKELDLEAISSKIVDNLLTQAKNETKLEHLQEPTNVSDPVIERTRDKRSKKPKQNSLDIVKQNLTQSSTSPKESSLSPFSSSKDDKFSEVQDELSNKRRIDLLSTRKPMKKNNKKYSVLITPDSSFNLNITSPTLSAGAYYIETQLTTYNAIQEQALDLSRNSMPVLDELPSKEDTSVKQKPRNQELCDDKTNGSKNDTPSHSKPKHHPEYANELDEREESLWKTQKSQCPGAPHKPKPKHKVLRSEDSALLSTQSTSKTHKDRKCHVPSRKPTSNSTPVEQLMQNLQKDSNYEDPSCTSIAYSLPVKQSIQKLHTSSECSGVSNKPARCKVTTSSLPVKQHMAKLQTDREYSGMPRKTAKRKVAPSSSVIQQHVATLHTNAECSDMPRKPARCRIAPSLLLVKQHTATLHADAECSDVPHKTVRCRVPPSSPPVKKYMDKLQTDAECSDVPRKTVRCRVAPSSASVKQHIPKLQKQPTVEKPLSHLQWTW